MKGAGERAARLRLDRQRTRNGGRRESRVREGEPEAVHVTHEARVDERDPSGCGGGGHFYGHLAVVGCEAHVEAQ